MYNKEEYFGSINKEKICEVGRYNAFLEKHTAKEEKEKEEYICKYMKTF